jgi:Na+-driven multidrug efflux pump
MTWTKLTLILVIGVALAFALRYFLSSDPILSFYRSTYHGGANATGRILWEVAPNVLAFWLCLIVTLVLSAVLGGRMLLEGSTT